MKEKKERFIELLRSTGRQGIEEVINYLEESGFFTAPASTSHHLSYEGGLMEHSMNVYDMAIAMRGPIVVMKPEMEEKLPTESIIIAALLHQSISRGNRSAKVCLCAIRPLMHEPILPSPLLMICSIAIRPMWIGVSV